jgi:hypothetical protein
MSWLLVQCNDGIGNPAQPRQSFGPAHFRFQTFPSSCSALPFLPAIGLIPANAQDSQLKGLAGVRIVVTWTGGTDPEKDALQADAELKLRQAGMRILVCTTEEG